MHVKTRIFSETITDGREFPQYAATLRRDPIVCGYCFCEVTGGRLMAGYEVEVDEFNSSCFHVKFKAPAESTSSLCYFAVCLAPYEGGVYTIRVELSDQYPFRSPSIGFVNRIFHPNIDEKSGTVCLDVINQTWTPLYSLVNVFDTFLPQLLAYPNPADPLNPDAAQLMNRDKSKFDDRVREYVSHFALSTGSISTVAGEQSPQSSEQAEMNLSDIGDVDELELDIVEQ